MGLEEDKKTVAGCIDCKYRHPRKRTCMLGRDPVKCASPRVRRGDEELFERIVGLSDEQVREQRKRFAEDRRKDEQTKPRLGVSRDSDWA